MTLRSALAVALLVAPQASALADGPNWRNNVPSSWLAAVEAPRLERFDDGFQRLLEPWGLKPPSLRSVVRALVTDVDFAERPWAIVVATSAEGGIGPILYLPTDNHERFCRSLSADEAGDLWVARLAGYDVVLREADGWTQATLLAAQPDALRDEASLPANDPAATVSLSFSPAGLSLLGETLEGLRQGQVESGLLFAGDLEWPSSFEAAFHQFAPYAPLVTALAQSESPLTVDVSVGDDAIALRAEILRPTPVDPGPSRYEPPQNAIAFAEATGKLPANVVDLVLAWWRCQPDEIEAQEYPQPEWDDFAEACHLLTRRVDSYATVLALPGPDDPVAANQATAFRWTDDADSLGDAVQLSVVRWNALVESADTLTPLLAKLAPSGEEKPGWRLSVDLVSGMGLTPSDSVEDLLDRFYGSRGELRLDLGRRSTGDWLLTVGPRDETWPRLAPVVIDGAEPSLLIGRLSVDGWLTWRQRAANVGLENAIGYRVRPPMAESPPAELRVRGGESLQAVVWFPFETHRAMAEYWRSEKQPFKAK